MRGKYSPTVTVAYQTDQEWHRKYAQNEQYDPEGFDSYGYNADDMDRAGNYEHEYYVDDVTDEWGSDNWAYNRASDAWIFDGEKPVHRYPETQKPQGAEVERLKEYLQYLRANGYQDAATVLGNKYL